MRKINLITFASIIAFSTTSCSGKQEMPDLSKGHKIDIVAYAGPTVSIYGGVNTQKEEHFKKVSDAGFTHILALYEGSYMFNSSAENEVNLTKGYQICERDALVALDFCEKYGLKYYVRDWNLQGLGYADKSNYDMDLLDEDEINAAMKYIFPDECKYIKHAAYAGNYVCDEPFYSDFKSIGYAVKAYKNRMAELGVTDYKPIVNLLPNTAGGTSLGPGYDEYVDTYLKYIGQDIGYISYDAYPLKKYGDEYILKTTYLRNLQQVAKKCNDNNLSFNTYIQSKGDYTGIRDIKSVADIRFQANCNLSFGSYDMTYYEYGGRNSASEGQFSLFNLMTGEYNWTWDCAKQVNKEIHAIEDIITNYRYDDIMVRSVDKTYECPNFLNLSNPKKSFDNAEFISITEDTYMTKMVNKNDGSIAYMLMNYSDPGLNKTDTVKVKFKDAKTLVMYRYGQKITAKLPSAKGEYTFKLGPGEGRFIIPLN